MSAREFTKADHDEICRKLADQGKIIAAGFVGLRLAVIPPDAPQSQIDDMETAYMGGAQHLWSSILGILDPDAEPTVADLHRMDLISRELAEFAERLKRRVHGPGH